MVRRLIVGLVATASIGGFGTIPPASAHCYVNTGECDGGHCAVNTGTCNGGYCYVNTGSCSTDFLALCQFEEECPITE